MLEGKLRYVRIGALVGGLTLLTAACARDAEETAPEKTIVPGSPPAAVFAEPRHDFGDVLQGERVEHAFVVRNDGGTELILEAVEADGMLTADGYDSPIPSGGEGTVRVSFDTAGRRGTGQLGTVVRTNDPELPQVKLVLSGRVVLPVEVEPQDRVYFFGVAGEDAEKRLTVVNHQERPLEVTAVSSDQPLFDARLETLEAGQRYGLVVRLDAGSPPGIHEGILTVTTDSPARPEITILARASLDDLVALTPRQVHFSRFYAKDLENELLTHRQVRVERHHDAAGFEVLGTTTDIPFLDLEVRRDEKGFVIHVVLAKDRTPKGDFAGTVRIYTNDPGFAELELPVSGGIL